MSNTETIDKETGEITEIPGQDPAYAQTPLKGRDLVSAEGVRQLEARGGIDPAKIPFGNLRGGFRLEHAKHLLDLAKVMATTGVFMRPWLRGNVGGCVGMLMLADEWQMSFYALANKSYVVKQQKSGDIQLAFESQLVHAMIERHAPLSRRLRAEWLGAGPTRQCKIIGYMINEPEPFEWTTPEIGKIKIKNSPEWDNNPDKQLFYHGSRDWGRIWTPDVLMGVYSRDELDGREANREESEIPVPGVLERLAQNTARAEGDGFDQTSIQRTLAESRGDRVEEVRTPEPPKETRPSEPPKASKSRSRKSAPEPERTQEPEPEPAAAIQPTDSVSYASYAEGWLKKVAAGTISPDDAEARWDGEREDRAKCKVTVTERKRLEKLLKETVAKARGAK